MDRVIFKRCPDRCPDVIAFLPDNPANPGKVDSYMHVGQHGEANYEFYRQCERAFPDEPEVKALLCELRSIGYELKVVQRIVRRG